MVVFSSAYPSIDNFFSHPHGQCTKIVHAFSLADCDALTCGPCQGRDNAKDGGRRRMPEEAAAPAATVADDVWSMVNLAAVYFDCCASGARITM